MYNNLKCIIYSKNVCYYLKNKNFDHHTTRSLNSTKIISRILKYSLKVLVY